MSLPARTTLGLALVVAAGSLIGCSVDDMAAPSPAAPPAAPSPEEHPEPFECGRESDRGFERVVEVSRTENTSSIRIETNYFGGAMDAVGFGMSCLGRLGEERGFAYYVILDSSAVRHGTLDAPGNDWAATIGFVSSVDADIPAAFPELAAADREYPIRAASTQPSFNPALIGSDVWTLFSSPHFRYRQPGEEPSDDHPPAFWMERADKAEQRLSSAVGERARRWKLGDAAKSAAMAGRWESAEAWGRELLSNAESSADNYGQAVHDAHTALGLVALHRDDLDAARIHLLKSGMTPGSPTLGSFGPNMSLARELIKKDEREIVLEYFGLCRSFWEMGENELDQWEEAVRSGGMPTFGANLLY